MSAKSAKKIAWDETVPAPRRPASIGLAALRKALKSFLSESWQKLNKAYQRDSRYSPMARISTSQKALRMYREWCESRQLDPLDARHAEAYFGTGGACIETCGPAEGSPYQARKLLGRDLATIKKTDLQGAGLAELSETYYFRARLRGEKVEWSRRTTRQRWEGRLKVRIWVPTLELQPPEVVLTKGVDWYVGCYDAVSSTEIKLRARNSWVSIRKLIASAVQIASEGLRRERDLEERLVIESPFKLQRLKKAARKRRKRRGCFE